MKQYISLVARIARRYTLPRACAITQDDLIQEGMLGVLEAQHHYDPAYGVTFESYAAWWAKKYISEAYLRYSDCVSHDIRSLDVEVYRDDNGEAVTLQEFVADEETLHAEQAMIKREEKAMVYSRLQQLPPRHRYVIERLFLDEASHEEVAEEMHISKDRLFVIKYEALKKMQKKCT